MSELYCFRRTSSLEFLSPPRPFEDEDDDEDDYERLFQPGR